MRSVLPLVALLAGPACATAPDLFGGGKLVVYRPLGYTPGPGWRPRAAGLRADAEDLTRLGFRALVTERTPAAMKPVCRFFKRHGFASAIIGIDDPGDAAQLRAARALRRCADGYAIGDGGLATGRYRRRVLEEAVAALRRATGKPVTVREGIASYRGDPRLARAGDWVFPIATADPARGAQDACGLTMAAYRELLERGPQDRPVTLASAGLPTAGVPGANEHAQRAYFSCLASRGVPFAYDEAYDQPWAGGGAGTRGLFRADGTPKRFAWQLVRPSLTVTRTPSGLAGRVDAATPARFVVVVYARAGDRWRLVPAVALSRHGRWRAVAPADGAAVAVLAAPTFAPSAAERPPPVDGVQVFATAAVP
jgi:hypothetical protein